MALPIQLPPDWGSRARMLRAGFKCCHEQGLLTMSNLAGEFHPLSELTAYSDNDITPLMRFNLRDDLYHKFLLMVWGEAQIHRLGCLCPPPSPPPPPFGPRPQLV